MRGGRLSPVSMVALAMVSAGVLPTQADADSHKAVSTCLGKPVTIVASSDVTGGTEGDDVVAMEPRAWTHFAARGGNDTICLALGAPSEGRIPHPSLGAVDAGAGDDVVVNQSGADPDALLRVGLGHGNDSFTGTDVAEIVFAERGPVPFSSVEPEPTGLERDVIHTGGGTDFVETAAPEGGPNQDHVTFGPGTAWVDYEGTMGPDGALDVTAPTAARLQLTVPSVTGDVVPGDLVLDNVAQFATSDGVPRLRWSGPFTSFGFEWRSSHPRERAVSFLGSDAAETVTIRGGSAGELRMGGGADSLDVAPPFESNALPRSADGGAGRDRLVLQADCLRLEVDLADPLPGGATCDGAVGSVVGFEDVAVTDWRYDSRVVLDGTDAPEHLVATGDDVLVRSRGGADRVLVELAWTARASGGAGPDLVEATGVGALVRAGAGRDRVLLRGAPGDDAFGGAPPGTHRRVAYGGPGRDLLVGTDQRRPDRLVGGAGRDLADGRGGRRDYCTAEVTKRCERP